MVSKIEHKTRSGCPIACSLDILGDHWTLLIIRNLMFLGLREYKDMMNAEEQISSSILSERLKKLEENGVISSIPHPKSKRRKLYYLTPMGKDLIDVLLPLVFWAIKHLDNQLRIPPQQRAFLEKDPEGFKEFILKQLESWEKEYLNLESL